MRNIVILGSTGSIGKSALEVIRAFPEHFRVAGLSAHTSVEALAEQARAFRAPRVAATDPDAHSRLRELLAGEPCEVLPYDPECRELVAAPDTDVVLSAIVGVAGLAPALAALRAGRTLAVANKEPLVAAGPIVLETARASGAAIVPVDSEHSAVFQAMRAGRPGEVRRILLTASGGPFRERPLGSFADISPQEALRHPTWEMGPKITVDSATMMNKALEVVEAVCLFALPPDRIRVVVHPQSVVHSMVEFHDGSVVAQLGPPDMKLPVLFALSYPDRLPYDGARLGLDDYRSLSFEDPDPRRYPALALGYRAAAEGGVAGAVLNAANERAVELFLAGRIGFPDITRLTADALDRHEPVGAPTLDDVLRADRWARHEVDARLARSSGSLTNA